jgi:hypothetical protein
MDRDQLRRDIAETVKSAEIKAVANALRSGSRPNLGQSIDYSIETPEVPSKRTKPYRLEVEQWHLDAAETMLRARS